MTLSRSTSAIDDSTRTASLFAPDEVAFSDSMRKRCTSVVTFTSDASSAIVPAPITVGVSSIAPRDQTGDSTT